MRRMSASVVLRAFLLKKTTATVYLKTKCTEVQALKNGKRGTESSSWGAVIMYYVHVSGRRGLLVTYKRSRNDSPLGGKEDSSLKYDTTDLQSFSSNYSSSTELRFYLQRFWKVILQLCL